MGTNENSEWHFREQTLRTVARSFKSSPISLGKDLIPSLRPHVERLRSAHHLDGVTGPSEKTLLLQLGSAEPSSQSELLIETIVPWGWSGKFGTSFTLTFGFSAPPIGGGDPTVLAPFNGRRAPFARGSRGATRS